MRLERFATESIVAFDFGGFLLVTNIIILIGRERGGSFAGAYKLLMRSFFEIVLNLVFFIVNSGLVNFFHLW